MTQLLVPPGFRFEPNDEELITVYLIPMIKGRKLPCDIIRPTDVYGPNATPWEIFDDHKVQWIQSSESKHKNKCYVFTKLTKKGKGSKNFERTAGCGTWDGQCTKNVNNDHGKVIGSKKYYSFKCRGFNYETLYGHYGMHEYFVKSPCDFVLCAITRDFSNIVEDPERPSLGNNMVEINGDVGEYLGDHQEEETSNDQVASDQVALMHVDESGPSVTHHDDQVPLMLQVVTTHNNDLMLQNITVDSVHQTNQANYGVYDPIVVDDQVPLQQVVIAHNDLMLQNITVDNVNQTKQVNDGVYDPIVVDDQIDVSFRYADTLSSAGGPASIIAHDQIMLEDQYNACGNPSLMDQSTNYCFGNQTLINNGALGIPIGMKLHQQMAWWGT